MAPLGQGNLPELSPELREWLAMVIDAAHRLRNVGSTKRAVALLRLTAGRVSNPKHVGAGLHALADLFAAHPPQRGQS
jgi:hypothetical protein